MLNYKLIGALCGLISTLLLQGCSMNQIKAYEKNDPLLKMEEYFSGPVKGYGLICMVNGQGIKAP